MGWEKLPISGWRVSHRMHLYAARTLIIGTSDECSENSNGHFYQLLKKSNSLLHVTNLTLMILSSVMSAFVMVVEPEWRKLRHFSIYSITRPKRWWPGRMMPIDVSSTIIALLTSIIMYSYDKALTKIAC